MLCSGLAAAGPGTGTSAMPLPTTTEADPFGVTFTTWGPRELSNRRNEFPSPSTSTPSIAVQSVSVTSERLIEYL